jgi:hypothetical protein
MSEFVKLYDVDGRPVVINLSEVCYVNVRDHFLIFARDKNWQLRLCEGGMSTLLKAIGEDDE